MDIDEIKKIAKDNNFELTESELLILEKDLEKVIKEYKNIEEVDTKDVKPLFNPLEDTILNRFGKDEISEFKDIEKIYDKEKMIDNFYQVPNKEGN